MVTIIVWAICMSVMSDIAARKGMNSFIWGTIGLLLGLLSLLLIMAYPVNQDAIDNRNVRRRKRQWCPFCKEAIYIDVVCCFLSGNTLRPQENVRLINDITEAERTRMEKESSSF